MNTAENVRHYVSTEFMPSFGCEDFDLMTREAGGWIGAGEIGPGEGLLRSVPTPQKVHCHRNSRSASSSVS
ncbi:MULTISPECIES: hypothetical protein [unclassified Mesorhizobium]|uniref:hypothetical protein n=1 Tax=unclassified Mesorhizobium TaxID=325217 RepID=UPI00333B85AC